MAAGDAPALRPTLLVVDDVQEIVRLIVRIFSSRNFRVIACGDGGEALKNVSIYHPDVILLDLHLPVMDGWQVCRELKADPATASIPIVMMTAAHTTTDAANKGIALGADEYVIKPFVREVLVHNVERLMNRKA
jgi:CheY-like chemotaxis protein